MTVSGTTPAIFRMLAVGPVTLLFDEIGAVFNGKSGGNHEGLRALCSTPPTNAPPPSPAV